MGSNLNFKNFGNESSSDGGGGTGSRPPGNFPLARQTSIYSMTFDEWSSMGGFNKDFGSMNMDELLKNIWNAEEAQTMAAAASTTGAHEGLQRQGSLTLPRTLSQKTVDEVWKDVSKECGGVSGSVAANMPPTRRQQTLGEMTLEEFLFKAGAVREDAQLAAKVNGNGSIFADFSRAANNLTGLGFGFQQSRMVGLSSGNNNSNGQIALQPSNLPLNVNGVRSNQVQGQQPAQQHQQQPQQILPKQPNMGYMTQMSLQTSPAIRAGITGVGDQGITSGLMQGGTVGMVGLGGVPTGSPPNQLSSNGMAKTNGDTSSVSPVPYVFNGGLRGRRASGTVEKVVERRQRRMIKNRESAARSRARKQFCCKAYTVELEAEVAKLKEENHELLKKQDEIMEMQKNQVMEMINMQQTAKKRCLRRTQTGPW